MIKQKIKNTGEGFFLFFSIICITIVIISILYNNSNSSSEEEVEEMLMSYDYLGKPITVIPGEDFDIIFKYAPNEYDVFIKDVYFNTSSLNFTQQTLVKWFIDSKFVSSNLNYHHRYRFNSSFHPSHSIIELHVNESFINKQYISNVSIFFNTKND